jgi:hypothetical protein
MLRNIAFRVAQQQSAMRPPHVVTPQQDESLVLIQGRARRGLYLKRVFLWAWVDSSCEWPQ